MIRRLLVTFPSFKTLKMAVCCPSKKIFVIISMFFSATVSTEILHENTNVSEFLL